MSDQEGVMVPPLLSVPVDASNSTIPAGVYISFTGGKDSLLVTSMIKLTMPHLAIKRLVTFGPMTELAHPIAFIKAQSRALGFDHQFCEISGEPSWTESYRSHFRRFADEEDVRLLATGDVEDVADGFLGKTSSTTNLRILSPIYGKARDILLKDFREFGLKPLISFVSLFHVPLEVAEQLLGRYLDDTTIAVLNAHNERVRQGLVPQGEWNGQPNKHNVPVDMIGENGEFHTMCLDGTAFEKRVCLVNEDDGRAEMVLETIPRRINDNGRYFYLEYDVVGKRVGFDLREK
ncbi:hypothetical protein BC830DRAFT_1143412 [Chytriomyces sp. MP71]|nr:hypothetical protein BC830DRAFT_1143412 [Chytriomyces sp. MP71]